MTHSPSLAWSKFLVGMYVPHGFSKVGSTEQIFFLKETWIVGAKFRQIRVFGANILPKSEGIGPKMPFSKRGKRTDIRCRKVGLWSGGGAWKGDRQRRTYSYTSDMRVTVPPGIKNQTKSVRVQHLSPEKKKMSALRETIVSPTLCERNVQEHKVFYMKLALRCRIVSIASF